MPELTTHERYRRMFEHRDADRVPIIDYPWGATVERWQREGMPKNADFVDYFGLDRVAGIGCDISPRYPTRTVEETDEYAITTTGWGVTFKNWKHIASTPEYVGFTIVDRDSWLQAKARMTPTRDRVNWDWLKANYRRMREQGAWIQAGGWFGFDITHAWVVGTERLLMALAEDPEWCLDMFNHELDMNLALFDMIWNEGYTFDSINWPDDMGYKQHTFFSVGMYRELLKPVHKRMVDWAHAKGIYAHLHSCGDVRGFVPDLMDIGIDALNPLEVKAGMDPLALKQAYGDRLVLHGGINALLYEKPAELEAQMRALIPVLKKDGGYILSSDHSVPSSMSLEHFRRFVALGKELGRY